MEPTTRFLTEQEKARLNRQAVADFIDAGLLDRADRERACRERSANPALFDQRLVAGHQAARQLLERRRQQLLAMASQGNALTQRRV